MPVWALAVLAVAFLAALAAFAFVFTTTHPIEQEDPWPPSDATLTSAPEQ